ncbi:potassium channel family protein [Bacillus massilinigeriensis]|uniref:potassium channel family protein n=1 Tax=Bacillus massilionigeriensis TaxID=1805475 RepID=UPI00096B36C1|nr:potassium channel family protein [Bacillus massilionigeriensis]
MSHHLYTSFLRLPLLLRILLIAVIIIFTFGLIISVIEPNVFPTIFDGIWWAMITASTVGYGDLVPESILGRVIGMILIFLGAGILSSYFVALSTTAVTKQNEYMEGKMVFKGRGHFIIVGWNERSRVIISTLLNHDSHSIILIDQTLESNPIPHKQVHFIKGMANLDDILMKANIAEAEKVILTADQNKDEQHADMNTILTLLAIKGLNPNLICIVEILTSDYVANAKRAGADEIIQSNVLTSYVMSNCLSIGEVGHSSLLLLLNHLQDNQLSLNSGQPYEGYTVSGLSAQLLKQGTLLIGIRKGEETLINPPHTYVINNSDQLLVVEKNRT